MDKNKPTIGLGYRPNGVEAIRNAMQLENCSLSEVVAFYKECNSPMYMIFHSELERGFARTDLGRELIRRNITHYIYRYL